MKGANAADRLALLGRPVAFELWLVVTRVKMVAGHIIQISVVVPQLPAILRARLPGIDIRTKQ